MALGGWDLVVSPAEVDERVLPGEDPREYVLRLAETKARQVAQTAPGEALIVAADTTVVDEQALQGSRSQAVILGKPRDQEEAALILRQLRGRTHLVYTGLAVFRLADQKLVRDLAVTEVIMRDFSEAELEEYVRSGDPMDKAGAYAIQHAGFHPVEKVNGCFTNVMGLPICHLARMLLQFGFRPPNPVSEACLAAIGVECLISGEFLEQDLQEQAVRS